MAYPTGISFQPTSPIMGMQPIAETSTTKRHELGTIVKATDVNYGEGEFIYLVGVASTAAGDLVCFNSKTGATTRTTHAGSGANGPCGVAMAANVASQYGWYQINGSGPVKSATVSADTALYITSTAGQIDDLAVSGDLVDGLLAKAASSGGFTVCQVDRPNISGLGGASGTNTGDVTLAAIGSSANANGATLAAQVLNLEPASASFGGIVTTGTQTIAGDKTLSGLTSLAGTTTITAFATGGQASATALTKNTNFITTCATAADSVKLPTAALGLNVTVFNSGAAACAVFPASGAAIDSLGSNNAYSVPAAASRSFCGQSATQWVSGPGIEPASATAGGIVTTGTQTIAGAKTLSGATVLSASSGNVLLVDTDTLVVDATNDRIGVGLTDPSGKLHVELEDTASNHTVWLDAYSGGAFASDVNGITFRTARGTKASQTGVKTNDQIFFVSGRAHTDTAMATGSRGAIALVAAQDWTASANGSEIQFKTCANGGTTSAAKWKIANDGSLVATATNAANTYSGTTTITAFATGGQASAVALTTEVNFVTVCATNGDSVKLPTAALGKRVVVFNAGAANCAVFPVSGSAIDALGANNAYTVNTGASREFWGQSATVWLSK